MRVLATYEDGGRAYCFEAPAGTKVGDALRDSGQFVTVVELGDGGYKGPVRSLERVRTTA